MRASCQKRLICLVSTLHGIANCIKNGTIWKNVPPAYGSISPQCRPQLLSDRFENLINKIFRNENSTLKINVSLFGCCIGSSWSPLLIPGSVGKIGKFIAKINGTSLQVLTRCMNTKIFWKVSWKTVSTCKDRMSGLVCLNFFHYIQDELHVSVLSVSHAILFYGYYPTPYWRNLNRNEYKSNIV